MKSKRVNEPVGRNGKRQSASAERLGVLKERALRAHGETLFQQVTKEVKDMVKAALGSPVTRTSPGPTPKRDSATKSSQAEMDAAFARFQSRERRRLSRLCLRIRKAQLAVIAREEAEMAAEYARFKAEALEARSKMQTSGMTPEQIAEAEEWLAAWGA